MCNAFSTALQNFSGSHTHFRGNFRVIHDVVKELLDNVADVEEVLDRYNEKRIEIWFWNQCLSLVEFVHQLTRGSDIFVLKMKGSSSWSQSNRYPSIFRQQSSPHNQHNPWNHIFFTYPLPLPVLQVVLVKMPSHKVVQRLKQGSIWSTASRFEGQVPLQYLPVRIVVSFQQEEVRSCLLFSMPLSSPTKQNKKISIACLLRHAGTISFTSDLPQKTEVR